MSVNWQWKDKMGTIQCSDYQGDYTLNVYSGNCLCVLTYEYIEKDVEKYTFHGFFNDLDHLKICVGLKKDYNGELKIFIRTLGLNGNSTPILKIL